MDIQYKYTKIRKNFGRQPMFSEVPVHLLDSIDPDISEQNKYSLQNPVNREVQATATKSETQVNTKRITYQNQGVNHAEGGWPKEIHFADEELTSRYRRRVERDDTYVDAVLGLYSPFEHYIEQNNAIDMYDMFFKGMPTEKPVEKFSLHTNKTCIDSENRPVACLCWTIEDDAKLAIAYCDKKYSINGAVNSNLTCYVWDLENPYAPSIEFQPPAACWQIVCSPAHPSVLVGGLEDGRVCIFDIRYKKEPVLVSPKHLAHRDPVSTLMYITSRLNTEFFSGSSDGQCMWWDIRDLARPTDTLVMSVRIPPGEVTSFANSEGVSALQYDRSFPTRFLCGTDTGIVINVNRKGKTHNEVMSSVFFAHRGPVRAVHRSPCTSKMFITCGDWTVNIWSDDIQSSPIVTGMAHQYEINDVAWAPQRVSSYMCVSGNGKFLYWDLLRKYRDPVVILPVSKHPLSKIKPHEEGRLVAIGDSKGTMYVLSLSESLVMPGDRDKQLMYQIYERETRREHILETRVKEIRLKLKAEEDSAATLPADVIDEEALIKTAEDEYKRIVSEEMNRHGIASISSGRGGQMRKR